MPPSSRLPLPRLAMFGIAMNLAAKGHKDRALMVLAGFNMYLRPGEALDLRKKNIVPPVKKAGRQFKHTTVIIRDREEGRPDKVGVFDNSLPIDVKSFQFMGEMLLQAAAKCSRPQELIFKFTMDEFRKSFQEAGAALGLEAVHPYQLRHGGATNDLAAGVRDFQGVKSRGRWKTDQSVRRYAKTGRIQQLLTQMSAVDLRFCRWAEANMCKVMTGQLPAKSSQ